MSLYRTQVLKTPATHRSSLAHVADAAWSRFGETLSSFAWAPLARLARESILGYVNMFLPSSRAG
jgi:hypothetical protein